MRTTIKHLWKTYFCKNFEGFSLIEISMVLLIMGIIAGGVMKGQDLVEIAQLKSLIGDIQNLQLAYANYTSLYNALPGNDKAATAKFGSKVTDGSGSVSTSVDDAKKVFSHLYAAGLINSERYKTPKIGGIYDIVSEDGVVKLRISNNGNPSLNGKQVVLLIAKMKEVAGEDTEILETDPKEVTSDKSKKYIVKAKLN
ncbi:MAG: prepilin-type N-terminal cleavage/methylation domain-containing protein [Holosporales bacterium]|jgi:prepilin-type N-terminal cleavage/methylation domain-containing protein|nr:prepilin-type N-terminal cleavage/methylation domain-containing protein [Holosporales bacterium]